MQERHAFFKPMSENSQHDEIVANANVDKARFTSYKPWLPVSIVMSPVTKVPDTLHGNGVAYFKEVSEQQLVDSHFNSNPDRFTITVFKEFEYEMTSIFLETSVAELIRKSVNTPNAALLLTPHSNHEVNSLGNLAKFLERSDILRDKYILEKTSHINEARECFGIYIQSGNAYFFGKSVDSPYLEYHRVPGTNIVISICWEADKLGRFKRKLFDLGSCLVLHPSSNSSENVEWNRYKKPEDPFPENVTLYNVRWGKTVENLVRINPQMDFIHVDHSSSGIYITGQTDLSSISLQREEEQLGDGEILLKRVLEFSSRYADEASYNQAMQDRKFDETVTVPDSQGCVIS